MFAKKVSNDETTYTQHLESVKGGNVCFIRIDNEEVLLLLSFS